MHFPVERDFIWYAQLTAEHIEIRKLGGQTYREWVCPRQRHNEATDCRVYNYAALCGLLHFGLKLNRRADDLAKLPPVEGVPDQPVARTMPPAPRSLLVPPPTQQAAGMKSIVNRLA
jgi:phage terminase large subunit GpA-like protein